MSQNTLISPATRLPYNPKLSDRAKELRCDMTPSEKQFWFDVLKSRKIKEYKFLRQRIIDHYIVDFFCEKLNLVIEIDGGIHKEQIEYDRIRSEVLMNYGLIVVRFTNDEVMNDVDGMRKKLMGIIKAL